MSSINPFHASKARSLMNMGLYRNVLGSDGILATAFSASRQIHIVPDYYPPKDATHKPRNLYRHCCAVSLMRVQFANDVLMLSACSNCAEASFPRQIYWQNGIDQSQAPNQDILKDFFLQCDHVQIAGMYIQRRVHERCN